MVKRLAVVGCGGHGQDVADIAADQGFNPVFYDSRVSYPQVMGRPDELTGELPVVVAVNDPAPAPPLAPSVPDIEPVREDQDGAARRLAEALAILEPPQDNEGDQGEQDQQQGEPVVGEIVHRVESGVTAWKAALRSR